MLTLGIFESKRLYFFFLNHKEELIHQPDIANPPLGLRSLLLCVKGDRARYFIEGPSPNQHFGDVKLHWVRYLRSPFLYHRLGKWTELECVFVWSGDRIEEARLLSLLEMKVEGRRLTVGDKCFCKILLILTIKRSKIDIARLDLCIIALSGLFSLTRASHLSAVISLTLWGE